MWAASSVQCRHWSRHMAKASFIPHAWVTNTHKSTWVQPPCHARVLENTCKQVNELAPGLIAWQLQWRVLNSLAAKQIKSEGKLSQVGAFKLQTGLPLFRPMWASSVQCRHWSRHMAKASFIPHAWVTNTHKSKCSHLATPECSKTPVNR